MKERIDFIKSKISKHKDSSTGFVKLEATPTRVGVLVYKFEGKEIRELRHPDEVFREDSMQSLAMKPFTLQHDGGLLNPLSAKNYIKGSTGENITKEGDCLKCNITVFDSEAIKDIEDGKAVMLSAGYTCDTVDEKGTYKGERYDRRQINIKYNHVSGVELGRAGNACRLRLDSDQAALISGIETQKKEEMKTLKLEKIEVGDLRLDSIQVEESDGVNALLTQRDTLVKKLKESQNDLSKKDGRLDALEMELKTQKENSDKMISSERLDSLLKIRADINGIAESAGYDLPSSGSFEEVNKKAMCDLLKDAGFKADRLDSDGAYLDAAWDQWTSNPEQLKASLMSRRNLNNNTGSSGSVDYSQIPA